MIEHRFHLTEFSGNKKTRIPTTTTSRSTCPDSCLLKDNGCYAEQFHMKMHWDKVDAGERGGALSDLVSRLKRLPYGGLVRHNQAGDLPGDGKYTLLKDACLKLAKGFRRLKGFTYTSYPMSDANVEIIKEMSDTGLVVNKSCFSLTHVDRAMDLGLPATVVLPSTTEGRKLLTPKGRTVARCPAELSKDINCGNCGGAKGPLCLRKDRTFAVGFVAHGIFKKKVDAALANYAGGE